MLSGLLFLGAGARVAVGLFNLRLRFLVSSISENGHVGVIHHGVIQVSQHRGSSVPADVLRPVVHGERERAFRKVSDEPKNPVGGQLRLILEQVEQVNPVNPE